MALKNDLFHNSYLDRVYYENMKIHYKQIFAKAVHLKV